MTRKGRKPDPRGDKSPIRIRRRAQGMSLGDLAIAANISNSYLSRIEIGSVKLPDLTVMQEIVNALDASVNELWPSALAVYSPIDFTAELARARKLTPNLTRFQIVASWEASTGVITIQRIDDNGTETLTPGSI